MCCVSPYLRIYTERYLYLRYIFNRGVEERLKGKIVEVNLSK